MSVPLIDITSLRRIPGGGKGTFSHRVEKRLLHGAKRVFFCKEMESPVVGRLELLAQEFFRLIIQTQPETRLAYHPRLNTYYILSEEVEGYENLPLNAQDQFAEGAYPNLGKIMLVALVVQEIDLKNGNIGINAQNQIIKIDGDWCFAAIRDAAYADYDQDLTQNLLNCLPVPVGYSVYNWLDIRKEKVATSRSLIVDERLANAKHFRDEINEAILKILLIPPDYIKDFVDAYIPSGAEADIYISYLKRRCVELKQVALQNESFRDYLLSDAASSVVIQQSVYLQEFKSNGEYPIIKPEQHEILANTIKYRYRTLISYSINDALNDLSELTVDFSLHSSKTSCVAHRFSLLTQVNDYIELISKPEDPEQLKQYYKLLNSVANKRDDIRATANRILSRLEVLEQIRFDTYLNRLSLKQKQMESKAASNPHYKKAAEQMRSLNKALFDAKHHFLSANSIFEHDKSELKNKCLLAVSQVENTMQHHREWMGILKKFILDLCSVLTFGLMNSNLSLFAKTDSTKKLDDFKQALTNTLQN